MLPAPLLAMGAAAAEPPRAAGLVSSVLNDTLEFYRWTWSIRGNATEHRAAAARASPPSPRPAPPARGGSGTALKMAPLPRRRRQGGRAGEGAPLLAVWGAPGGPPHRGCRLSPLHSRVPGASPGSPRSPQPVGSRLVAASRAPSPLAAACGKWWRPGELRGEVAAGGGAGGAALNNAK